MKIIAQWWTDKENFGDALTPYIIGKLSGITVTFKGFYFIKELKKMVSYIVNGIPYDFSRLKHLYFIDKEYILGVGSILGSLSTKNAIAWGSGFIRSDEIFKGKKVCAVRGKYSAQILHKQGFHCNTLGDPCILLPLVYTPKIQKKYTVAIIPNFSEYEYLNKKYRDKYHIIDLRTSHVENIVNEINSCHYILSTSLHGIITAQAYGIPALWIENTILGGDTIYYLKFKDYFSSVGIEFYQGFKNEEIFKNTESIIELFKQHAEKSMIKKDLSLLQIDLLSVAPFPILKQYKKSQNDIIEN